MRKLLGLLVLVMVCSILLCPLAATAIEINRVAVEGERYTIETQSLNEEWLHEQLADADDSMFLDVVSVLYIMNSIQYGPYADASAGASKRPPIDSMRRWLEMMDFDCNISEIEDGLRLVFSDQVYLDVIASEDTIVELDMCLPEVQNGYGNDLHVKVALNESN